jgi:hypothetical protein
MRVHSGAGASGSSTDKVCDFCKGATNHRTKNCLSKAYHERMVGNGKDPKEITIPPLEVLQKEAQQLKLQKQLAWGMSGGNAPTNSSSASGASPGQRTRSHDNASMAHFSSTNTEDSDYARVPAPSASAQTSANHKESATTPVSHSAAKIDVPEVPEPSVRSSAATPPAAAETRNMSTTATEVTAPAPSRTQQSIRDNLEAALVDDGDGAFEFKPIDVPTASVDTDTAVARRRYPSTPVSFDEFGKFEMRRLDFSKAYPKASAVTALEIVYVGSVGRCCTRSLQTCLVSSTKSRATKSRTFAVLRATRRLPQRPSFCDTVHAKC